MQTYQYHPSREMDYLLLNWLERMRNDQEFSKTFSKGLESPSAFLESFKHRVLFFKLDELGNIALACWLEPCMGSVFLSYWAHPAYRKHREVAHFIFDMFDWVFGQGVPVICGFIQERPTPEETKAFIKLHNKMGYEYRGSLPKFFDGKDCHVVALTAEAWANPKPQLAKWQARRDRHR